MGGNKRRLAAQRAGTAASENDDPLVRQWLSAAFDHYRNGRLDKAISNYRRTQRRQPSHPDAVHFEGLALEGLALLQPGRSRDAFGRLTRSVELSPSDAAPPGRPWARSASPRAGRRSPGRLPRRRPSLHRPVRRHARRSLRSRSTTGICHGRSTGTPRWCGWSPDTRSRCESVRRSRATSRRPGRPRW